MHSIAPTTARQARMLRLVKGLVGTRGIPTTDGEQMVLVNSHIAKSADVRSSSEAEAFHMRRMPNSIGESTIAPSAQHAQGNLYLYREMPMYPGEYVPAQHHSMASLRDGLRMDLSAQSIKDAWMRVTGRGAFATVDDYYSGVEGIDAEQIAEVVSALLPGFSEEDCRALVTRVLEGMASPSGGTASKAIRSVTAEALGLGDSPGHYANFMEWMGRLTETKAFQTEYALHHFMKRKFAQRDVVLMNENFKLINRSTLERESSDGYSHFYGVLRDLVAKVGGESTRPQLGVRIDEAEVDPDTGIAVGYGQADDMKAIAYVRENSIHEGAVTVMGSPMNVAFDGKGWLMEQLLWPFDEAALDVRQFDVYIENAGTPMPSYAKEFFAFASRMAIARALSHLLPLTRIPLKKSGLLSFDRRRRLGDHPGYLDGKRKKRHFRKR